MPEPRSRAQRRLIALIVAALVAAVLAGTARAQKWTADTAFLVLAIAVVVMAAASTPWVMSDQIRRPREKPRPKPDDKQASETKRTTKRTLELLAKTARFSAV